MTNDNTAAPGVTARLAKRAGFASLVGTTIEWYDYFIFGTASAVVFGRLFFPGENPVAGTLASFAVFGVGFVARPLGGLVFGHYGDKFGRKGVLIATLMITGLSTMAIGILPTYAAVGVWAPAMLVVLRLIQGFGVGGEWGGASLVAVEYAPPGKRGLYGSLPQVGNGIGVVLATGVFTLVAMLPDEALFDWGWRVPFLASAVLVAVGAFIRLQLAETPAFLAAQEDAEARLAARQSTTEHPLRILLRDYRRPLLLAMGVKLAEDTYGYIVLTFLVAYTTSYTTLPRGSVLLATTLAGAGSIVTFFLVGALSDRVGRRNLVMIGAFVGAVMAFPFFWLLNMNSVPLMFTAVLVTYLCGNGVIYAVQSSFFSEMFDTSVRYSGISLAYQMPTILVGAIPFAATAMVAATGSSLPVSLLLVCTSLLGLGCAYLSKDARNRNLEVDQFGQRPVLKGTANADNGTGRR